MRMSGNEHARSFVRCDAEDTRDQFGIVHGCEPGRPREGNAIYGNLHKAAYQCGCQPAIHRFKCAACQRVVGWCFGGAGTSAFENACCDACVVAVWDSADRLGLDRDDVTRTIDADATLRERVYALLRAPVGVTAAEVTRA